MLTAYQNKKAAVKMWMRESVMWCKCQFFFSIRPAAKSGFEEKFLKYWTKKFDGI